MCRLYIIESFKSNILNSLLSFVFIAAITFILFSIADLRVQAQGFGARKIKVSLSEKLPPAVYPVGADILLNITSKEAVEPQYVQYLQSGLKVLLPRFDWRLNIGTDKPETLLSCEFLEIQATSRSGTVSRNVYKKIGEHGVTDPETGAFQVVEDFAYVMENFIVITIEGHASLRYQITDKISGTTLDANTLTTNFGVTYDYDVPSIDAVYKTMTDNLATSLASRFGSTFKPAILVNAPKGRWERASNFLKSNKWNSAIEEIKRVQPLKKPEDDAYRLYALGLAYEGLAYETADLASSKSYLEQAANFYIQASRQNVDEADMQLAALRTSSQVESYRKLESPILAYETSRQQKGLKVVEPGKLQSYFGATKIATNDIVIGWAKSGVSEKVIRKQIEGMQSVYFDLSASGMADLASAGVQASLIDTMRRTMNPIQVQHKSRYRWLSYAYTYAIILAPFWLR